jgi:prolyl 4-hydroxylase
LIDQTSCDDLIRDAKEKGFVPSQVGSGTVGPTRRSSTSWLDHNNTVVAELYQKINRILRKPIPTTSYEKLQVVEYLQGHFFSPHFDQCPLEHDYCQKELERYQNKPRLYTVLIALNQYGPDYDGGGTRFPNLDTTFRLNKGDALFFRNVSSDGTIEQKSLHEGIALLSGVSYLANVWVRGSCHHL